MPTTFQHLFNKWMERNYKKLIQQMPMRDMMHDAYVTVYKTRRTYLPTDERFCSLMDDAYHRHVLKELNHQMHYILPDPLFWSLLDEEQMVTPRTKETANKYSLNDMSSNSLKNLFTFVRNNFSANSVTVFKMAVVEQMSYADIAKAMGMTKPEVKNIINNIENAIRMSGCGVKPAK